MRQEVLFRDKNFLFNGDNLDILRYRLASESVDLVYLDPPFNSNRDFNLLFKERDGKRAAAQIKAFGDTWRWDQAAVEAYHDAIENGPEPVGRGMEAFKSLIGETDMLAYLSMMAPRLVELHRVLKDTGSLYLHCDSTASHYLKLLMDAIFGPSNFRNEVIWKRANSHNDPKRYGRIADTLLYYSKEPNPTWNQQYTPYREDYYKSHFKQDDDDRWWRTVPLDAPKHGKGSPALLYDWKGKQPASSRTWAVRREIMERYEAEGKLRYTRTGTPTLLQYADEMPGVPLQSIWTDIPPVNPQAKERLPYPTQKPLALLERIILSSSNEGDTVLDPFCGCGTAIDAAHKLKRRWVGIDITQVAIDVITERLEKEYGPEIHDTYTLIRDPVSVPDALALAGLKDKYEFQWWVLDRLGAAQAHRKKGADKGVDGRIYFHDTKAGPAKRIIIQVKGGKTGPKDVRDLLGTMGRDKATIGVFVTIKKPTRDMQLDAMSAGVYHSDEWGRDYARLQIMTVEDIIAGRQIDYPTGEWHTVKGFRPRMRPEGRVVPMTEPEKARNRAQRAAATKTKGARSVSRKNPRRKQGK